MLLTPVPQHKDNASAAGRVKLDERAIDPAMMLRPDASKRVQLQLSCLPPETRALVASAVLDSSSRAAGLLQGGALRLHAHR